VASIIDTFVVMLGLDTKGMQSGEKEAEKSLKDLETHAKETASAMKEHGESAGEFYSELMEKAAAFFAFIAGGMELKEFVKSTVEAEVETSHLSELIGMSGVEIQRWRGALVLADGKASEFDSSIKHLSGSLVDIAKSLPRSERAIKSINAALGEGYIQKGQKKDLLTVLDDLTKKAESMDLQTANRLFERILGGNAEAMVRLLRKGSEEVNKEKEKAGGFGVFSEEDQVRAVELKDVWNELSLAGRGLARSTVMDLLMPALKGVSDLLGKLAEWAQKHPDGMKALFIGTAVGVGFLSAAAASALVTITPLMIELGGMSLALGLLAAGAYELYTEWDRWLPQLNDMIPGMGDTLQIAKQGITEYGKMWHAMIEGNEEDAEMSATRIMEHWKDLLNRISRQIMWEILDIFPKMIRLAIDIVKTEWKGLADWSKFFPTAPPAPPPGKKHQTWSSGDQPAPGQSTSQQPWTLGWAWEQLFGPGSAGGGKSSSMSITIPSVTIQTTSTDPAVHGELFSKTVADSLGAALTEYVNGATT